MRVSESNPSLLKINKQNKKQGEGYASWKYTSEVVCKDNNRTEKKGINEEDSKKENRT